MGSLFGVFLKENVIIFSTQRARHVYPELDPHLGRASGGYVVFAG